MNLRQLWSIMRGQRTNFRWMDASWTYAGAKLDCVHNPRIACPGGDSDECCLNEEDRPKDRPKSGNPLCLPPF